MGVFLTDVRKLARPVAPGTSNLIYRMKSNTLHGDKFTHHRQDSITQVQTTLLGDGQYVSISPDNLRELYSEKGWSVREIARESLTHHMKVWRRLREYGIEPPEKPDQDTPRLYTGGYRAARSRRLRADAGRCLCGKDERDQIIDVHHVFPIEEALLESDDTELGRVLGNSQDNLVTLCRSCHRSMERMSVPEQFDKLGRPVSGAARIIGGDD